jgi:hypothetical protein
MSEVYQLNDYRRLELSLIYYTDEMFGFNKCLHHYQQWLTSSASQQELENLIIEVGKEHFVDLYPLLDAIKNNNNDTIWVMLEKLVEIGPYVPAEWNSNQIKLSPGDPEILSLFRNQLTYEEKLPVLWKLSKWVSDNKEINKNLVDPLSVLAYAMEKINESRVNFYKVFDLLEIFFGNETLLSCVIREDIREFIRAIGRYNVSKWHELEVLAEGILTDQNLNWIDALSRNQVKSKLWLLEKLQEYRLETKQSANLLSNSQATVVVGGWVGMLPYLATSKDLRLGKIINVDIDESLHNASVILNQDIIAKYQHLTEDIKKFDFKQFKNLLVIDTIVEHFVNHGEWVSTLPKGTTVILQGNNMFDVPDHVNCHHTLEEFVSSCGLANILWAGELILYKCTRFMAIGTV